MARALSPLLLSVAVCVSINFAALAASEPCKDCKAPPELTARERIKAERALDADRVAKESAARPWDGTDIGQAKRANAAPIVH